MAFEESAPLQARLAPAKPVLKWAGGKSQLLSVLLRALPKQFKRYAEPFLGGGALFFRLATPYAVLADSNPELIHFYTIVRDMPWALLHAVATMPIAQEEYYTVRSIDPATLGPVERAARFVYLNKTCYNGLHRVNRRGQFNTPFGGKTNVTILDEANLVRASAVLQTADLRCCSYETILSSLQPDDFVYLDPPYVPVGQYSDFKRYTREFFGAVDHAVLARHFRELTDRGVLALLSNSSNPMVEDLYEGYAKARVQASRQINCMSNRRGKITELLIANYPLELW